MRKYLLLPLLVLLLTACEPMDPYTTLDMSDSTIAAAQATREQSRWAITATADASGYLQTAEAARATEQAFGIYATESSRATDRAYWPTATAAALESQIGATQTVQAFRDAQVVTDTAKTQLVIVANAQSTIVKAQSNLADLDDRAAKRRDEREERLNGFITVVNWTTVGWGFLIVLFALAIYMAISFGVAFRNRLRLVSTVDGAIDVTSRGATNLRRMPEPAYQIGGPGGFKALPVADATRTERTVARAQMRDTMEVYPPGHSPKPLLEARETETDAVAEEDQIIDADWRVMDKWPGGPWCLGSRGGEHPAVLFDYTKAMPHLLAAGTTGSGKTFGLMRPVTAQAIADGMAVLILTRGSSNYNVFRDYPNARTVDLQYQAEQSIDILRKAYRLHLERQQVLQQTGAETWSEVPDHAPIVLIVIDELHNLAQDLRLADGRDTELWTAVKMIAQEGRKTRIFLLSAVQDPSAKNVNMSFRRMCSRVAFKVSGMDASKVIIDSGGAENLEVGQFILAMDGLQRGVAFNPSDEEIRGFIARRGPLPAVDWGWLEVPVEVIDAGPGIMATELLDLAEKIRPAWEMGESKRKIAESIGKTYAGYWARKIDAAITYLENAATTSPTHPDFEGDEE